MRVPVVDDNGQTDFLRERELAIEEPVLSRPVGIVVVVVQSDFPDRDRLFMPRHLSNIRERVLFHVEWDTLCVRWMEPDCGIDKRIPVRQRKRGVGGGQARADIADVVRPAVVHIRDRTVGPRIAPTVCVYGKFRGETVVVIMGMGVEKSHGSHRTRSPSGASSARNTTRTSSSPDARIIPFDSMPHSTAGFRLATKMIFLPMRASGS